MSMLEAENWEIGVSANLKSAKVSIGRSLFPEVGWKSMGSLLN